MKLSFTRFWTHLQLGMHDEEGQLCLEELGGSMRKSATLNFVLSFRGCSAHAKEKKRTMSSILVVRPKFLKYHLKWVLCSPAKSPSLMSRWQCQCVPQGACRAAILPCNFSYVGRNVHLHHLPHCLTNLDLCTHTLPSLPLDKPPHIPPTIGLPPPLRPNSLLWEFWPPSKPPRVKDLLSPRTSPSQWS